MEPWLTRDLNTVAFSFDIFIFQKDFILRFLTKHNSSIYYMVKSICMTMPSVVKKTTTKNKIKNTF